jgi:integrase
MAGIAKLTVSKINKITRAGRYSDGLGLYLQVTKALSKSWVFRYERDGKERNMGLGPFHTVSLDEAREEARNARVLLRRGLDPLRVKRGEAGGEAAQSNESEVKQITFDACAKEYIQNHQNGWKNNKSRAQWESSLRTYASPHFGNLPVGQINTLLVLNALKPIWITKTETASRLRERIERVLSFATTSGYRNAGENPARWHGHLQELLPRPSKIKKVRHHPAMSYKEIGAFCRLLQREQGLAARALEMTILTACRSNEVLNAQWREIDLIQGIWIIPGERMKSGREHRIPLVGATLAILRPLVGLNPVWVFPATSANKALPDSSMLAVLHRIRRDVTVHGFRSTFRVWAAEEMACPGEIAELALAHKVGTAVEGAYLRSDLFEHRRLLMRDWAAWCAETTEAGGGKSVLISGEEKKSGVTSVTA